MLFWKGDYMDKIITISRQYGSGGREIGHKVAKKMGIPFYDNEIITQAAKESGFAEVTFEQAEEKATNSFLYSIAMGMSAYGNMDLGFSSLSVDDKLFLAESKVIRNFAKEGPCVIVGRCADYVLKDFPNVVNLFIAAELDFRIKRATQVYELAVAKAGENIIKFDKRRANYYNYHAGQKWGNVTNYHLSIRSDLGGIEHTVDTIIKYLTIEN